MHTFERHLYSLLRNKILLLAIDVFMKGSKSTFACGDVILGALEGFVIFNASDTRCGVPVADLEQYGFTCSALLFAV